jgi:peptidoglycan/LPS O-acetylase OafA/YrhL
MEKASSRFDVARGVLALVVLATHSCQVFLVRLTTDPKSWLTTINGNLARQAVLVFFVLSGFLITRSIIANIRRNGSFDPTDYLSNRVARIYPPFLFALAIAMLVAFIVQAFDLPGGSRPLGEEPLRVRDHLEYTASELWHALLMQSGMTIVDGPLWTLYIEVKIYFIAMGAALIAFGRNSLYRFIGGVIVLAGVIAVRNDYASGLFACAWLTGSAATAVRGWHGLTRQIAILSLALVGIAVIFGPFLASNVMDSPANKVLQMLCCLLYAQVMLVSDRLEIDYPKPIRRTGDFSYTLYVTHAPVLFLCLSLGLPLIGQSWLLSIAAQAGALTLAICLAVTVAPVLENVPFYRSLLRDTWIRVRGAV